MRIRTTKTRNGRLFYVIKTYYDTHGKEHSVTVKKLGNENAIREKYNCDPDIWAREYVAELNKQEKEACQPVQLKLSQTAQLSKNEQRTFNIGYLFLKSLYYRLGLHDICKHISKQYAFEYDLDNILSRLIFGRILYPCSKIATCEFSKKLLEQPKFTEFQVYRSLDVIEAESDYIQAELYKNSVALGKRHSGVIYYDCTNFFFEIEEADEGGLRQYGRSKENRPLPIVEMGMFIDSDGIPLSVCIHPGNTNEQATLKPMEERIISDFGISKFIVCTDAGLASKANRKFNDVPNRAYIVTQSIKTLKKDLKAWALDTEGWERCGQRSKQKVNIANIDPSVDCDTIFYKSQWIKHDGLEEKIIVTFSMKYKLYQQNIRQGQIDRAQRAIDNGSAKRSSKNQNDYRRFINKLSVTKDGEAAEVESYSLNDERIREEEQYDGFYAVSTNLEDREDSIIKVNKYRWKIEECFRIMKTEFKARPAYLQKSARIKAHFLTCFLALVVYRYLEKQLKNEYSCEQIIRTLREMNVCEIVGDGYIPTYTRTDITDALHEAFGFRSDYEIISRNRMKKILRQAK